MSGFAPFPDDVERQTVSPFHCNCRDVFYNDTKLISKKYAALQDAIHTASDTVHWRETYKDTDIGTAFMDRFACYCIIGENAPFSSASIRLFMVYMPPHLYYPWHHHPAEEMYMVVSGNAVFRRKECPEKTLFEGDTSFHASNQPHAMETKEDPVLCLVAWRDDFETPPVLTKSSETS
jgi:quercetin dioxygenase-like cupin family protein